MLVVAGDEAGWITGQTIMANVEFVDTTPEQVVKEAIASGTPAQLAGAVQNLNERFRAGRAGVIADDIENLTGVAPQTFRDWCERHADEFAEWRRRQQRWLRKLPPGDKARPTTVTSPAEDQLTDDAQGRSA